MLCDEFKSSETVLTNDMIISASEAQDVINNLSCGKSPGLDRISSEHLTCVCVFTLKEIIRYYINHGSLMYVTFLDASQAFDRVNHTVLLPKLLFKLITFWYCN